MRPKGPAHFLCLWLGQRDAYKDQTMAPLWLREPCHNRRTISRSGIAFDLKKRRRAAALQSALRALHKETCALLPAVSGLGFAHK